MKSFHSVSVSHNPREQRFFNVPRVNNSIKEITTFLCTAISRSNVEIWTQARGARDISGVQYLLATHLCIQWPRIDSINAKTTLEGHDLWIYFTRCNHPCPLYIKLFLFEYIISWVECGLSVIDHTRESINILFCITFRSRNVFVGKFPWKIAPEVPRVLTH